MRNYQLIEMLGKGITAIKKGGNGGELRQSSRNLHHAVFDIHNNIHP